MSNFTNFGIDVSISGDGNVIAIGANDKQHRGAYVFDYDGADTFTQRPSLNGSGGTDPVSIVYLARSHGDGECVSLNYDGSILAVGASAAMSGYGAIGVFEWDSSQESWSQQQGSGYPTTTNPDAIIVGHYLAEAMGRHCMLNRGDSNGNYSGTVLVASGWRAYYSDDYKTDADYRRCGRVTIYEYSSV